jgi:hypothetical protein
VTTAPRGALAILDRAGHIRRDTVLCPHEASRSSNSILVHGWKRDMVLCQECVRAFPELTLGFYRRQIGGREVVARLLSLGYTRTDAARFLLELLAQRLRIRIGFLRMPE